ncbi:MAG TPA: hypothetical protein VMX13_01500 [Sedimentisphaerales bacterium]|nr:hypothetical protein [Sedimentisphaerales bacterium]
MRTVRLVPLALIVLSFAGPASSMFALPMPAPIDRLIANTTAYIKEKPNDAHGYYTLARIHYLAFANKSALVGVFEQETPPRIPQDWLLGDFLAVTRHQHAKEMTLKEFGYDSADAIPYEKRQGVHEAVKQKRKELEEQGWVQERISNEKDLVEHAAAALEHFQKAIALDRKNALYHLGLASLLEQYARFLAEIDAPEVPKPFRDLLLETARDGYYTAFTLSIKGDSKLRHRPIAGLQSLVSHEAAQAYIRLSEKVGHTIEDEADRVKKVRKGLKKLAGLPKSRIVTPVILSLEKRQSLADLLKPDRSVSFDLDGDGVTELWHWVKPTTGILVWDPEHKGQITSGRQMFGSVTWWLFFKDGYQALDALDDSRDGFLTGGELEGIRVWFDRDCDGISCPKEVVSLAEVGIISISTRASGQDGGCPICASGIKLSNGRTLPTYDWLTSPEKQESRLPR